MKRFLFTSAVAMCAAVKVVKAIRDRHEGLKRNPFNEHECGHNYA